MRGFYITILAFLASFAIVAVTLGVCVATIHDKLKTEAHEEGVQMGICMAFDATVRSGKMYGDVTQNMRYTEEMIGDECLEAGWEFTWNRVR